MHLAEQHLVGVGDVEMRTNDFLWNDEDVRRRLRRDILESQTIVVLINDRRRDFPIDDLLEDVLGHHRHCNHSLAGVLVHRLLTPPLAGSSPSARTPSISSTGKRTNRTG